MSDTSVSLEESWKAALAGEFPSPYMQQLKSFLVAQKQGGKRIFPRGSEYFRALDLTPISSVKAVILGQDVIAWQLVIICLLISFVAIWLSERWSRGAIG